MMTTAKTRGVLSMWMNRMVAALLFAGLVASGCDLDLNDPNSPTEENVFGDGQNLILVAIGLQAEAAEMMGPQIFVASLAADELGAGSATFDNFKAADIGAELVAGQYLSEAPWTAAYRVNKLVDDLLTAVPDANLRAGTRSGIIAMAKTFRAMAFGHLATLFEAAPLDAGIDNLDAEFSPRAEVLAEAISLLASARSDITATPLSDEFRNSVQAPGFNLEATIPSASGCGVRFRAGTQLGSPPTMGPPLKSGRWQPTQTPATCRPNSTVGSEGGGYSGWGE
jgi:hypothetical protein